MKQLLELLFRLINWWNDRQQAKVDAAQAAIVDDVHLANQIEEDNEDKDITDVNHDLRTKWVRSKPDSDH